MILKNLYFFAMTVLSLSFLLIYELISPVPHQVKTLFFGGLVILTIFHIFYFKLYNFIIKHDGVSKGLLFSSIIGGVLMIVYSSFIYYYSKFILEYANVNETFVPILNLSIPIIFFILALITFFIDKIDFKEKNRVRLIVGSLMHYGLLYLLIRFLEVFLLVIDMILNWS